MLSMAPVGQEASPVRQAVFFQGQSAKLERLTSQGNAAHYRQDYALTPGYSLEYNCLTTTLHNVLRMFDIPWSKEELLQKMTAFLDGMGKTSHNPIPLNKLQSIKQSVSPQHWQAFLNALGGRGSVDGYFMGKSLYGGYGLIPIFVLNIG